MRVHDEVYYKDQTVRPHKRGRVTRVPWTADWIQLLPQDEKSLKWIHARDIVSKVSKIGYDGYWCTIKLIGSPILRLDDTIGCQKCYRTRGFWNQRGEGWKAWSWSKGLQVLISLTSMSNASDDIDFPWKHGYDLPSYLYEHEHNWPCEMDRLINFDLNRCPHLHTKGVFRWWAKPN